MRERSNEAREVFKKNLNYYMKKRGLEQADIVTELGITASTVSDWVNGKKYPRVDAIRSLRQYCPHLRLQFSFSGSAFRDAIYAFLAAAPPFVEFSCSATAASMAARSAVKPRASSSLIT